MGYCRAWVGRVLAAAILASLSVLPVQGQRRTEFGTSAARILASSPPLDSAYQLGKNLAPVDSGDSLVEGILLGALGGLVAMAALSSVIGAGADDGSSGFVILLGAGLGAMVGAMIDASIPGNH